MLHRVKIYTWRDSTLVSATYEFPTEDMAFSYVKDWLHIAETIKIYHPNGGVIFSHNKPTNTPNTYA